MRVPWRREFDPARDFVVRKPVTAGGRKFAAGETFDPSLVTVRRLRQMFDAHVLVFAGDQPGAVVRRPHGFRRIPNERELAQALQGSSAPPPGLEEALAAGLPPPRRARAQGRPGAPPAPAAAEPPAPAEPPTPEALERARRAAVEIPQDWERQPWNTIRALAKEIDPDATIGNKEAALAVIGDEIAHRAGD